MNALTTTAQTMSSLDLFDLINKERIAFGEGAVRRNDFHARVADELDGEHYESFVVENPNGTETVAFRLTLQQCMYIAMRESKGVRRKVQSELESVKNKAPAVELSRMDILKLAMESEEARIKAEAERDEAIRTKAQISDKKTATAMATAAAKSKEVARLKHELGRNQVHATVKAVKNATGTEYDWRALKAYCKGAGLEARKVADEQYGSVKAWPAMAWRDVHGVDLETIFPSKEC